MANLNTKQSYYLTYTASDGTIKKIDYSEKISKEVLMSYYNENALVEAIFRPNSRLVNGTLSNWEINQMKLMREKRQSVVVRDDTKIDFKTYNVDLTTPINIYKFTQNTILSNDDMLKSEVLLQSSVAKVLNRNRAAMAGQMVKEAFEMAKTTKLWATSDVKQSTNQPATATTTNGTLTALKNGQKVSGLITDLFAVPTNQNDDYNAFKVVWTAVKELKKLGTAKSKEKYYPFVENGFTNSQIMILASTDLIEKLRADPRYKAMVMKQGLQNNQNEWFTITGYINGIPVLECNQLEDKIEAIVMTKDALLVADLPIKDTPLAKIIQGDGARREIDGVVKGTPMDAKLLMTEGKFAGGIAFPNEMIFIRAA